MAEDILGQADKIFRWEGPKRKQTLFSAKLGRLVLTSERLLFLSTGKNDVTLGRLLGGATSPLAGLRTSSTEHLDVSVLGSAGSLDIPLGRVARVRAQGHVQDDDGHLPGRWGHAGGLDLRAEERGHAHGPAWVEAITKARADGQ